jgi:hypothetical protein
MNKEAEKRALVEAYHDTLTAGHLGIAKTLQGLHHGYRWPKMRTFLQAYVKGCTRPRE